MYQILEHLGDSKHGALCILVFVMFYKYFFKFYFIISHIEMLFISHHSVY